MTWTASPCSRAWAGARPSLTAGAFFEAGWGNYTSHNSFDNAASVNGKGDTSYYGAHLGAGYVWHLNGKSSLDFSTKYIQTHQNGDSVDISGDSIKFKAADSQRWRSGARFSYVVNAFITPYAGTYYDHEFNGKARATVNGDAIDAPELKGGTGIGEVGLTLKPSKTLPLDLGVQGYVGRRQGVAGSVNARVEF